MYHRPSMARADSPLHHALAQEERQPMLSSSASSSRPPSPTNKGGFANIPLMNVSSASSPSPSTSPRIPSPPAPGSGKPVIRVLDPAEKSPAIWGMPLKYVSLVTLAVQNAALAIVMHYSRVSIAPSQAYSPATAVLMNEILKGSISLVVAVMNESENISESPSMRRHSTPTNAIGRVMRAVFSPDCWKLSIPAILYVIQNSLQFVAVANLPVATFQVTYQLKILTTACFSVMLLRKRLSRGKWAALLLLAAGVAIVQIQTTTPQPSAAHHAAALIAEEKLHRHQKFDPALDTVGSAAEYAPPDPELDVHVMHPMRGFAAVAAACFTSGLAGVYFEMVLKGSKADLWVRNVQLSLFSLVPALLPVLRGAGVPANAPPGGGLFTNFGGWAWATVMIQVAGGLVTAVVIKHADNILKGFATSLSILLSFLASVALFDFALTPSFVAGASTVLFATWLYNQPAGAEPAALHSTADKLIAAVSAATGARTPTGPGSPVSSKDPIIGAPALNRSRSSTGPFGFASALGLGEKTSPLPSPSIAGGPMLGAGMESTARYLSAPYGSPFASPFASPVQSRVPSRAPSPTPVAPPPRRGTPGSMSRSASFEGAPVPQGMSASASWPGVGGQHQQQGQGHATSPLANQGWRAP